MTTKSTVADAVDFVDFQQSRPCWIQLCCQCVPGFRTSCAVSI